MKEWLTIHVTCKSTDHAIAPKLIDDIALLLRRHGVHNHEFGFFWGDEPTKMPEPRQDAASTKPRKPRYAAIEAAGRLANKQVATLRNALKGRK